MSRPPEEPKRPGDDEEPELDPEAARQLGIMSIWEHLDELRKRVTWAAAGFLIGCVAAWTVVVDLLEYLHKPFREAWVQQGLPGDGGLHVPAPGAQFIAYLKLSMIGGAALASPFIFYQLWSFVAPGLYSREKRFVIPFVVSSTVLFVGGGYFGWSTAFPITFNYFLSLSGEAATQGLTITPTIMVGDYVDFTMQLLFGFGLVFELPLLILFLSIAGIVNYLQLIRFGRWFVLIAFAVAAVLTPPDVTSQMVMAIPMLILYGFSIGLAFVFGKRPTAEQREEMKRKDEAAKAAAEAERRAMRKLAAAEKAQKQAKALPPAAGKPPASKPRDSEKRPD
jgi:sec-independent protein translocase protein TatC